MMYRLSLLAVLARLDIIMFLSFTVSTLLFCPFLEVLKSGMNGLFPTLYFHTTPCDWSKGTLGTSWFQCVPSEKKCCSCIQKYYNIIIYEEELHLHTDQTQIFPTEYLIVIEPFICTALALFALGKRKQRGSTIQGTVYTARFWFFLLTYFSALE